SRSLGQDRTRRTTAAGHGWPAAGAGPYPTQPIGDSSGFPAPMGGLRPSLASGTERRQGRVVGIENSLNEHLHLLRRGDLLAGLFLGLEEEQGQLGPHGPGAGISLDDELVLVRPNAFGRGRG